MPVDSRNLRNRSRVLQEIESYCFTANHLNCRSQMPDLRDRVRIESTLQVRRPAPDMWDAGDGDMDHAADATRYAIESQGLLDRLKAHHASYTTSVGTSVGVDGTIRVVEQSYHPMPASPQMTINSLPVETPPSPPSPPVILTSGGRAARHVEF